MRWPRNGPLDSAVRPRATLSRDESAATWSTRGRRGGRERSTSPRETDACNASRGHGQNSCEADTHHRSQAAVRQHRRAEIAGDDVVLGNAVPDMGTAAYAAFTRTTWKPVAFNGASTPCLRPSVSPSRILSWPRRQDNGTPLAIRGSRLGGTAWTVRLRPRIEPVSFGTANAAP